MRLRTVCKNFCVVSTVDLMGIPHGWVNSGDYYFETAVISDDYDIVERYKTEAEAAKGHNKWVTDSGGASPVIMQIANR